MPQRGRRPEAAALRDVIDGKRSVFEQFTRRIDPRPRDPVGRAQSGRRPKPAHEGAFAHGRQARQLGDVPAIAGPFPDRGSPGFVLLDVRSPALFAKGHVPGAVNLPHAKIIAAKLREYPKSTLFVSYCAGPHCNGAARGAARLARLGFAVKLMAGGMTGWIDEGFELERL
jgi:rhodanese-related sulfurtransferase